MAQSFTGGVKAMQISTRLISERERLLGMTDEERAWRKKWLKDQILSPNEPKIIPEMYKELRNPIRRAYRLPLDMLFKPLESVLGQSKAAYARYYAGKLIIVGIVLESAFYYLKYNRNDWTKKGGWRITYNRTHVLPGHPGYPQVSDRTKPSDYSDRGFKNSPI